MKEIPTAQMPSDIVSNQTKAHVESAGRFRQVANRLLLSAVIALPVIAAQSEPHYPYDTKAFMAVIKPCVELNNRDKALIDYSIKHGDPVDLKASTGDTGCDILLGRTPPQVPHN